jgi:hypothetical protein
MSNIRDYFELLRIIQTEYSEKDFTAHDIDFINKIFDSCDEIDIYNRIMEASNYDIMYSFEFAKQAHDCYKKQIEAGDIRNINIKSAYTALKIMSYLTASLRILKM